MFASAHRSNQEYINNNNLSEVSIRRKYNSKNININKNNLAVIKIWQTNNLLKSFECIKTIRPYDKIDSVYLNKIGTGLLISYLFDNNYKELKIWSLKTYECLKSNGKNSEINYGTTSIVTKRNNIITITDENIINLWKIQPQL